MDSPSTSAAALKLEIARLTGVINQRKTAESRSTTYSARPRNNVYVNPQYKPASKTSRPAAPTSIPLQVPPRPPSSNSQKRDVVIGGVAFESSGRSLIRKDLPKPPSNRQQVPFDRSKAADLKRAYKAKVSRRTHPRNRNMTLNNSKGPYQSRRLPTKRKYSDKPCPRFTTTGACNRGLTCMYQHDPSKIAICWNFLQGNCPNTAETCPLSHDPTPERTPLCAHFANNGRCTRPNCPFPHVRVGQRHGVCRDFAVLGYCAKGLDCDKQHVRECPDFAEKGECTTRGCKLPHVIRANRNRKVVPATSRDTGSAASSTASSSAGPSGDLVPGSGACADVSSSRAGAVEDAQLGDEFISLTFHESESEEDDDDEEGDDGDDTGGEEEEIGEQQSDSQN